MQTSPQPQRRSKTKRPATRERLIRSAMERFAEKGYERTTIVDIERAAGLSPGAGGMYRHFASKEELLVAGVQRYRDEVAKYWEALELSQHQDVSAALSTVPVTLAQFAAEQFPSIRVFALQGPFLPERAREEIAESWDDAYRLFAEGLRRLLSPAMASRIDVEAVAVQLFASIAHYVTHGVAFGRSPAGVPLDRFVRSWVDTWCRCLGEDDAPGAGA